MSITQKSFARKYARYSGDSLEASLTGEFQNLYFNGQPRSHTVFFTTPTADDLKDGDVVLTQVAGVSKIVVKISGALFHSTLTAGA